MAAKFRDSIIVSPVGQIYTTAQVASILQVHRRTVERLIMEGRLQAIHVGRRFRVTSQQLQDFVTQQQTSPQIPTTPVANDKPL